MADSAIQKDVPATPNTEAAEVQKSARELAMEALELRHQQEQAASNGYELMANEEVAAAPEVAAPVPEPVDELASQLAETPATPVAAEPPGKIKVKVDGVETEVPLDEVVRQYQKNSSADRRLNEATRLLREAQEAQAARLLLDQQEAQLRAQQQQQQQAATTQQEPAAEVDASGKEFLKALFEGDEENALSALQKVIGGRQPAPVTVQAPTLDIDQITSAVTQQVQQKLVVESALAQNRHDYPELYADPDMEALALTKIQRLREQDGSDFFTALETVSKDMATKFGWNSQAAPGRPTDPAPTTSRTAKLEQKKSIDNVSHVNTKTTSTEQQPENPSDVIAAMRAARLGS